MRKPRVTIKAHRYGWEVRIGGEFYKLVGDYDEACALVKQLKEAQRENI